MQVLAARPTLPTIKTDLRVAQQATSLDANGKKGMSRSLS
jgi:hypothetical protein